MSDETAERLDALEGTVDELGNGMLRMEGKLDILLDHVGPGPWERLLDRVKGWHLVLLGLFVLIGVLFGDAQVRSFTGELLGTSVSVSTAAEVSEASEVNPL